MQRRISSQVSQVSTISARSRRENQPSATASMHGADIARLGLQPGQMIQVASRRGQVALALRQDDGTPLGAVFIPFAYVEAAANVLTNAALDPFGKIPEFKYCAVRVESAVAA